MRVGYLSIDAAGRTGADNPLTKLKVRQAIWHAIDRQAIADKLVTGGSRVPAAPCFPSQFGCDAEAAVPYDYDPAKAKELLAEAGYPDGFEVELASYVLPQWGSAVQNYLHGGRHPRQAQPAAGRGADPARQGGRDCALYLGSWGSYSINDVSAIMPNFFNGGADDYARDPDVQKALVEGGSSNDPAVRKKAYSAAIKRITETGLLGAAAHLCDDLRLLQAARFHALPGRTAALLSGEVEVTRKAELPSGRVTRAAGGPGMKEQSLAAKSTGFGQRTPGPMLVRLPEAGEFERVQQLIPVNRHRHRSSPVCCACG